MTLSLALTGWPLGHSLSPQIHTAALQALGLEGGYRLCPVPPLPDGGPALAELLEKVRSGEIDGLNVTIPHKQAILPLLDELTPAARQIGAANTIYRRNDRLVGDNTDASGFLADLQRYIPIQAPPGGSAPLALVLGAGGAARAVIWALLSCGWQVDVVARRPEQAEELVGQFSESVDNRLAVINGERTTHVSPRPSVIVNTTPVGLYPDVNDSPWPDDLPLPEGVFVYDLVYNPRETALVRQARKAGCLAAGGLGMLVEQAALAFEIWTRRPAPRTAMMKAATGEI
jgi:shikimate dehydrogenase